MFDFEKLQVYQKAKINHKNLIKFLKHNKEISKSTRDQLSRASESVVLNIAEGAGKFSKKDKANFYLIARGSVFECVSVLQILLDQQLIHDTIYQDFYNNFEEIAKILTKMILNLGK